MELARIKPLEGSWSCKGAAPAGAMGPGSPEMKYTSTFTVKPLFDGFAYTLAYDQKKSKTHPMHFSGSWYAGWDGAQNKLVFFWLDNTGSVGTETAADWKGDDFVLEGSGYAMGAQTGMRDTLTKKSGGGLHGKGEFKGPSGWMVIGEDDCTKGK